MDSGVVVGLFIMASLIFFGFVYGSPQMPDSSEAVITADQFVKYELNALLAEKLDEGLPLQISYNPILNKLLKPGIGNLEWKRIRYASYSCSDRGCTIPYYSTINLGISTIKFEVDVIVDNRMFKGYDVWRVYLEGIVINDKNILEEKNDGTETIQYEICIYDRYEKWGAIYTLIFG